MAILVVQKIVPAGLAITLDPAAAGGDSWPNSGNEFVWVMNSTGGAINLTIEQQKACDFGTTSAEHHKVIEIAAGGAMKFIGPLDPGKYNDANGRVQMTYSAAGLVLGVYSL